MCRASIRRLLNIHLSSGKIYVLGCLLSKEIEFSELNNEAIYRITENFCIIRITMIACTIDSFWLQLGSYAVLSFCCAIIFILTITCILCIVIFKSNYCARLRNQMNFYPYTRKNSDHDLFGLRILWNHPRLYIDSHQDVFYIFVVAKSFHVN